MTIVLSTRNRPASAARAVHAILRSACPDFELVVVDQSDVDATDTSLTFARSDHRLRYIRSATSGLSTARNLGIGQATHEIIGLADDDCEMPSDWLQELVSAFGLDRRIGVVFGVVLPAEHDRTAGFVPCYARTEAFLARSIRDMHRAEGMGACMGVRRSVWEALCGFDEMLGAGAPFAAADDTDFAIRALLAGYFVYATPAVRVVHHGFRTWRQGQTLIHQYWHGTGAAFVKVFKCGRWVVAELLARLAWRWIHGRSGVAASLGRPHRLLQLAAFLEGFSVGAFTAVDRASGHYRGPRRHGSRGSPQGGDDAAPRPAPRA